MNMKWMSLVAVMTIFSAGCSEPEQDSNNKVASDADTAAEVQTEEIKTVEKVKGAIEKTQTPEQEAVIKKALSSAKGIPPEKLDSEVKRLVEKISENSDISKEDVAKLEQDLKSVFQKIEAERTQ